MHPTDRSETDPNKYDQPLAPILVIGPFALPLVWRHPTYNAVTKIFLTVVITGLTIWSYFLIKGLLDDLTLQLEMLGV